MAPKNRVPLAFIEAVILFFGLIVSDLNAVAYFFIWSMLGIWICRCLREPAIRDAI